MEMEKNGAEPILKRQYHIPIEMFRSAFVAFQRKFVYPRNYVMMGIFLLAGIIYAWQVTQCSEQQRPIYCMIVVFCILMIAFQWYNPRKIRRNLMDAVKEIENDLYECRIYPEYLEIGTILPDEELTEEQEQADALFEDAPQENFSGTRLHYSKAMKVLEYKEFFIVYMVKVDFYVLPKKAFSEEEIKTLREEFSKNLGKGYQSKIK